MGKKTIGTFIAILRKAKGLTQKDLAELLNVSDKAVSRWERDESAPDITLIPVLADIFEVSCDELLRGEKVGIENIEETVEKRTRRIKTLLNKSKHRFQAFSMIPLTITTIGVVVALICNFVFRKATLGFYCAFGCFVCAGMVLMILCHLFRGEVDTEEIQSEEIGRHRKYLRDHTLKIAYVIIILLGICMPLLLFGQIDYGQYFSESMGVDESELIGASLGKVQVGLQLKTWVLCGAIGGMIAAVLCFMADTVIKHFDRKKNPFALANEELETEKRTTIQRIKFLLIAIGALALTTVAGGVFYKVMPKLIVKGMTWETYEEFKEYMETVPKDMPQGVVELRPQLDRFKGTLYGENEELLCEYIIYNDDVVHIEYGDNNKLPITTYSEEDYAVAEQKVQNMMWLFPLAGILECVVVIGLYLKQRKK